MGAEIDKAEHYWCEIRCSDCDQVIGVVADTETTEQYIMCDSCSRELAALFEFIGYDPEFVQFVHAIFLSTENVAIRDSRTEKWGNFHANIYSLKTTGKLRTKYIDLDKSGDNDLLSALVVED
jgi:hypothetical protein